MKNALIYLLVFGFHFAMFSQGKEPKFSNVLKDSTVITYKVFELSKQQGFGSEKIVEGKANGDIIKIMLLKIEEGFQLVEQVNDDEAKNSNILNTVNLKTSEVYKCFMDVVLNTENSATLCLSKKQFGKSVITLVPEFGEETYMYSRTNTEDFSFLFNNETIITKTDFFSTKEDNDTLVKTVAFLTDEDLPIQTHQYIVSDYGKFYGIAFKLVSIDTKN